MMQVPPPPWTEWNLERPKNYRLLMNRTVVGEYTTRYEGFVAMAAHVRALEAQRNSDVTFRLESLNGDFIGACIVPNADAWHRTVRMAI